MKFSKNLFTRYTTNFDCGFETPWYYVIRENPINLDEFPSKAKYKFNYGLKHFTIKRIEPTLENARALYRVYLKASERYDVFRPISESSFIDGMLNGVPDPCYGAFHKDSGQICGYVTIRENDGVAASNTMKLDPDYFKLRVSYALIFTIVNIYLSEKKYKYFHNGERSIKHKTEMQNFLVDEIGFRRAYANIHVEYKLILRFLINIFYPFRNILRDSSKSFFHNLYSLLSQEQIVRETSQLFGEHSEKNICYQYYRLIPNKSLSNFKIDTGYELKIINPGFINVHAALWTIFSMGKFKEYQLYNSQEMVAYAQVVPKMFIFSFMGKNSLHIGPCWTHPDFRGKGLCHI